MKNKTATKKHAAIEVENTVSLGPGSYTYQRKCKFFGSGQTYPKLWVGHSMFCVVRAEWAGNNLASGTTF